MYVKGYVIAHRYILSDVLGRGSFAEVWSAYDQTTHKEIAVKICKAALIADSEEERDKAIHRFCDEIALMKRAKSNYVVEILDYGKEREEVPPHAWYYYIIMEKMYATLADYLEKRRSTNKGGIKLEEFLRYATHILLGLQDLHHKEILHRDIKPSNLFFSYSNILTIGDLGIARLSERSMATHTMFGTVGYAAPELFVHKKEASVQSDLFSVGTVFYEALTLRHPCCEQGSFSLSKEVIRRLVMADFYPLAEIRPDLPEPLIALVNRMIKLNPQERPSSAQAVLQEIQELRQQLIQIHISAGNDFLNQKLYEKAQEAFTQALHVDSENAQVYSNLGLICYLRGNFKEALTQFKLSLQYNPEDKVAYNNRGLCHYYMQNYEEAIRDFSRAIQIDPKFAEAYNNRGLAYHKKKEYYRALQNFNRALSLRPKDPRSYNNRGLTYSDQGDYLKAISDFTRAIKLTPRDAEPYFNRAMAYQRQRNYARAAADLTQSLEYSPQDMLCYYQRGLVYQKLGDYAKALADFQAALKLDPGNQKILKYIQHCQQKLRVKKGK